MNLRHRVLAGALAGLALAGIVISVVLEEEPGMTDRKKAAAIETEWEARMRIYENYRSIASAMSAREITLDLASPASAPSNDQFAVHASRLGTSFGAAIKTLYAESDGLPALSLASLAEVERQDPQYNLAFTVFGSADGTLAIERWRPLTARPHESKNRLAVVQRSDTGDWLDITPPDSGDIWIFYVPPGSVVPALADSIIDCRWGCRAVGQADIIEWLRDGWSSRKHDEWAATQFAGDSE